MSQDNNADLSQFSMMDLFRMEADGQTQILTDGLLAMERLKNDAGAVESMMRAAHSIKGAAAIVGLEAAVRLAHALEDVFVAAQHGRLQLASGDVDALLGAVDLMQKLSVEDGGADGGAVETAVAALGRLRGRGPAAPASAPAPAPAPAAEPASAPPPVPAPANAPAPASDELLTLAGQARLQAGRLRPWIDALQRDKRQQRLLSETLEQLQDAALAQGDGRLLDLARLALERMQPLRDATWRHIADAEQHERQAVNVSTRMLDELQLLRMCRFGDGVHALPRMVRDLARGLG
jgi:two-component system sensor histidine kinase and response regulator WspE